MATRFRYHRVAPAQVSPAFDASWEVTGAQALRRRMTLATPEDALSSRTSTPASGVDPNDVMTFQFVSDQIAGQTISGTVKGQVLVSEASAPTDARQQMVLYVVSGDGATVRGVLLAHDTAAEGVYAEFVATTATNRKFPGGAGSLTPVVAQPGDRIVAELGARVHSTNVGTFGMRAGGTGLADLPEDETTTADGYAWLEFSQDISFHYPLDPMGARGIFGM